MNLTIELKTHIYNHVGQVQQHLTGLPPDEQREILQSIETHIHDALESRADENPTLDLLEAIIAEMDPPESYGSASAGKKESEQPNAKPSLLSFLKPSAKLSLPQAIVIIAIMGMFFFYMNNLMKETKTMNSGHSPEPAINHQIAEGVGWSHFHIGASRSELIKALGSPDPNSPNERYMRWETKHIDCIVDEQRGAMEVRFNRGFEGTTISGIKIGTNRDDLIDAYGKPETTRDKNGGKLYSWPSKGIAVWFILERGAHQIIIFKPH